VFRQEKFVLNIQLGQKSYPPKIYFAPPNLKTWVRAWA